MKTGLLSTFDIGKLVGVHNTTVARWITKGGLKAYTTYGGHYRVRLEDLKEFVKENNIPFPDDLRPSDTVRVLIVEDNEMVLNVLSETLNRASNEFTVETAVNGFEAGQMVSEFKPDVIVLDIFLPGHDGFEVCKMVKEKYPEMKVIAMTGQGTPEVRERILKAGADEYLEKPFDTASLPDEIMDLIENVKTSLTA